MSSWGIDVEPAIVASTADIRHADRVADVADLLELRLDLGGSTLDDLRAYAGPIPVIVTNRSDAGADDGTESGRLATLREALTVEHVWGIDVDVDRLPDGDAPAAELSSLAATHGRRLVCSAHLDDADRLEAAAAATRSVGDVGKVVLRCDDGAAFGALVDLALEGGPADRPLAAMATGTYGPHSRLLAVVLGQPLVYGHVPGADPTAPGQLGVDALRDLRASLNRSDLA